MADDVLSLTEEDVTGFYYRLGRALWGLGAFENHLVYYIVVVLRQAFDSHESAQRELKHAFSLTLGNLLKELRKHREFSPDLDRRIDLFKAERDWLCHNIFAENAKDLANRRRFVALLERLDAFKREASNLHDVLDRAFDKWCEANDISSVELEEGVKNTLDDWRG